MAASPTFGAGVYDVLEASRLLGVRDDNLRRWSSRDKAGNPPLVPPAHGWAYSFHDLLSLAVIAVLRQRKVTMRGVRRTIGALGHVFPQLEKPLAHRDVVDALRLVGTSVLHSEMELDLSAGGQGVLWSTVERYLEPIEYGSDKLAKLWRPKDRILVDPDVQVGHPCVEGTRITTETISGRAIQREPLEVIAGDLRIDLADVRAALAFERDLTEGRGLALLTAA